MAEDSKTVAKFRSMHLQTGERIVASGTGYIGELMGKGKNKAHNGVLIVTDRRLCFFSKTFLSEVLETIPLKSITSIERKSVMAHRSVKFHTSNDSLEFKTFQKDALPALIDAIEAGRAPSTQAVVAVASEGSILDSISRLAELKASGVLTDEEFVMKKAELLSRL